VTRPKKERKVKHPPLFHSFKPAGIKRHKLSRITMTLAEFEAIRLADYEGLGHLEASVYMEISRSTFTRLIEKARKKVSSLIVEGTSLDIGGGRIHFNENIYKCNDCYFIFRVPIAEEVLKCSECDSDNLSNLAETFGHGRCCKGKYGKKGF
jgi:predicted DNA-binding protein (UPF0251 family)